MRCAVFGCNNNNKCKNVKMHAFTFPKCKNLREKWIKFCRRSDFNAYTSVICENHFTKDDFSNNMQFQMGFAKVRLLNATACPTVYLKVSPTVSDCQRTARKETRERKQVVASLLKDSRQVKGLNVRHEKPLANVSKVCVMNGEEIEGISHLKRQIDSLQNEIEGFRKQNIASSNNMKNNLIPEITSLYLRIRTLNNELRENISRMENIE